MFLMSRPYYTLMMMMMIGLKEYESTDVRAGLQNILQVFITHSCNVFLLDVMVAVMPGSKESAAQLVRLEDQVG